MAYPYQGAPLTPAIIAELIEECFAGSLVERDRIIREIARIHTERGGKAPRAQSTAASVKRALQYLSRRGIAENVSTGFWRISSPQNQDSAVPSNGTAESVASVPIMESDDTLIGSVYLYYLPLYRKTAERNSANTWPCKIGKSGCDPLSRILSQAATALPETPEVALIFDTEHAAALETALHAILTVRNKKIEGSPGNEWFLTSPDEILAIVANIDPKLKPRV